MRDGCVLGRCGCANRQFHRRGRQPAGRSRHRPFLFQGGPGGRAWTRRRSTKPSSRFTPPDCFPTSVSMPAAAWWSTVVENPGDQSGRLRRQQEGQGRSAQGRSAVEAARHAVAADRAGRRAAHYRNLSPQRPLRRARRAEDHRTAEQPRRSGVRDQRRRQDRREGYSLRRRPRFLVGPPEGRHQDLGKQLAQLPADHRHLRSRSR